MERLLSVVGRAEGTTTKADLVEQVAHATDLTKKQAEIIVDSVFDGIIASLRSGEKIELRGFGSFRLRQRGARIARNPKRSGVKVMVPPKRVPYFKPGKKLKELINQAAPEAPAPSAAPGVPGPRNPGAGPG
jgi:integration host factor subunit beta